LILAGVGALVVAAGSGLVISRATDSVLAGHYMSFGDAWMGLWLLALTYVALRDAAWPNSGWWSA